MSTFNVFLCLLSFADAHRRVISEVVISQGGKSTLAHAASSQTANPCGKARDEPTVRCRAVRRWCSRAEKNWLDCEAQKKRGHALRTESEEAELRSRAAQMDVEMAKFDHGNTPWGDTFRQATRERNAFAEAKSADKRFEQQIQRHQNVQLAKAIGAAVIEPFVAFFEELAEDADDAKDAVQKAIFVLARVPNLTKEQFLKVQQTVSNEWDEAKDMLVNFVAYGNSEGPPATTPERQQYLAALYKRMLTLDPIDPGPDFQRLPGFRENQRRETKQCAGYGRICGKDSGLACCSLSGDCKKMTKIENKVVKDLETQGINREQLRTMYICQ